MAQLPCININTIVPNGTSVVNCQSKRTSINCLNSGVCGVISETNINQYETQNASMIGIARLVNNINHVNGGSVNHNNYNNYNNYSERKRGINDSSSNSGMSTIIGRHFCTPMTTPFVQAMPVAAPQNITNSMVNNQTTHNHRNDRRNAYHKHQNCDKNMNENLRLIDCNNKSNGALMLTRAHNINHSYLNCNSNNNNNSNSINNVNNIGINCNSIDVNVDRRSNLRTDTRKTVTKISTKKAKKGKNKKDKCARKDDYFKGAMINYAYVHNGGNGNNGSSGKNVIASNNNDEYTNMNNGWMYKYFDSFNQWEIQSFLEKSDNKLVIKILKHNYKLNKIRQPKDLQTFFQNKYNRLWEENINANSCNLASNNTSTKPRVTAPRRSESNSNSNNNSHSRSDSDEDCDDNNDNVTKKPYFTFPPVLLEHTFLKNMQNGHKQMLDIESELRVDNSGSNGSSNNVSDGVSNNANKSSGVDSIDTGLPKPGASESDKNSGGTSIVLFPSLLSVVGHKNSLYSKRSGSSSSGSCCGSSDGDVNSVKNSNVGVHYSYHQNDLASPLIIYDKNNEKDKFIEIDLRCYQSFLRNSQPSLSCARYFLVPTPLIKIFDITIDDNLIIDIYFYHKYKYSKFSHDENAKNLIDSVWAGIGLSTKRNNRNGKNSKIFKNRKSNKNNDRHSSSINSTNTNCTNEKKMSQTKESTKIVVNGKKKKNTQGGKRGGERERERKREREEKKEIVKLTNLFVVNLPPPYGQKQNQRIENALKEISIIARLRPNSIDIQNETNSTNLNKNLNKSSNSNQSKNTDNSWMTKVRERIAIKTNQSCQNT